MRKIILGTIVSVLLFALVVGFAVLLTPAQGAPAVFAGPGTYDINGVELILDVDADTSITADTDDRVDFRIGGSDRLQYSSGAFAFQEATIISASAGNIELSATGTAGDPFSIKDSNTNGGTGSISFIRFEGQDDVSTGLIGNASGADANFDITSSIANADIDFFTNGGDVRLDDSRLFVNDTSNITNTLGLTINQAANTNEILSLKNSGVTHGVTNIAETDTFGMIIPSTPGGGGIGLWGLTEDIAGLDFQSVYTIGNTAKTTGSTGAIVLTANKKSGAGFTNPSANENIVVMTSAGNTVWILDEDGDIFYGGSDDGAITDDYNDVELLEGYRALLSPPESLAAQRFTGYIEDTEDILVSQGVLTASLDKGGLVDDQALTGLLIDAIRQLSLRIDELEAKLCECE